MEVKRPVILQRFVEMKECFEREVKSLKRGEDREPTYISRGGGGQSPPFTSEHLKHLNDAIGDYDAVHFPGSL